MSSSDGPVRRRRIAGESTPAAPAKKAPVRKPTAKKQPAKKAPAKKAPVKQVPAKKASATKATEKVSIARPAPVKNASVAPKASVPPRMPAPGARLVDDGAGSAAIPRRELRWLVPATVVAVAVLVAGALFAKDQISGRGGSDQVAASDEQAAQAAGTAAQTIFSFTYDKLPEHLTASKALMTKSFGKQFDKIAPALTELAPQRKIQVEAVARAAGALPCGDSCSATKADILVFVDQARLIGSSTKPTVFGNRITVSMVKQHGSWLVSDIRAL